MQNEAPSQKGDLRQRCVRFSIWAIRFVETLSQSAADQVLAKQFLRSATSIGANVFEAFGSGSKRDFAHFFSVALKSAKETGYWLLLFRATAKGDQQLVSEMLVECSELSRMIAASILTAKGER